VHKRQAVCQRQLSFLYLPPTRTILVFASPVGPHLLTRRDERLSWPNLADLSTRIKVEWLRQRSRQPLPTPLSYTKYTRSRNYCILAASRACRWCSVAVAASGRSFVPPSPVAMHTITHARTPNILRRVIVAHIDKNNCGYETAWRPCDKNRRLNMVYSHVNTDRRSSASPIINQRFYNVVWAVCSDICPFPWPRQRVPYLSASAVRFFH